MKHQKGSIHVIIIAVLATALLGMLGFVFWQNFIHKSSPVTLSTAPSKKAESSKNNLNQDNQTKVAVKSFTSPLSGFTVQYPSDWLVTSDGKIFTNNIGGNSS